MEKLLQPDFGLMAWTIVTFVLVVAILGKTAWAPIIGALEAREKRLKDEREAAEAARLAAEKLKAELDNQLVEIQKRTQAALAEAAAQGQKTRDEIIKAAQEESKNQLERTRRELADEKEKLVRELRGEVADLSVRAAERLLQKSVDQGVQKKVVDDFMAELKTKKGLS